MTVFKLLLENRYINDKILTVIVIEAGARKEIGSGLPNNVEGVLLKYLDT